VVIAGAWLAVKRIFSTRAGAIDASRDSTNRLPSGPTSRSTGVPMSRANVVGACDTGSMYRMYAPTRSAKKYLPT
jgi:hypothetical protein